MGNNGRDDAAQAPTLDASTGEKREDSFDAILRKVVRSGGTELVVGSRLVDRFEITSMLGEGGMGTVYVARDSTLSRDVAIKVHHAAGGASRLRREAVAMAKLAHPNVVTVFEVGELEGRPFVVMEYVPGTTLRAWLAETPRSVDEIVAMLAAAGEGLAAAHAVGLVHRDVKPENVLIGADGRARVGDFGLARELDSKDEPLAAAAPKALTQMTQTGAVLGTPAYMAPEQFAGVPVDARADQFAFCVTAWEALWSERPFPGSTFELLHAAITSGARRELPETPIVPARVREVLDRGLSVDPEQRFPSMRALLDALRAPILQQKRRRWLAAGGGAVVLAAGAAVLLLARNEDAACDDAGGADLAYLPLDLPMRIAARGELDAASRVQFGLDHFGHDFRARSRTACIAGNHEWSPDLLAKSKLCLAVVARTAGRALAIDPGRSSELVDRVTSLPSPIDCTNPLALSTRRAPTDDPARLEALIAAGSELHLLFDDLTDMSTATLTDGLARLRASPAHDDPEIAAGMTLLAGLLADRNGKLAESEKLFADAYYAGRAIDDDEIIAGALTRLIGNPNEVREGHQESVEWTRTAVADGERMKVRSPELTAHIYGRLAGIEDVKGDAKAALDYVQRGLALVPPHDPYMFELLAIAAAVDIWSGKIDDGITLYEKTIAEETRRLGPTHPRIGVLLSNYASSLLEASRDGDAMKIAQRAKTILEAAKGGDDELDAARVNLAATLIGAYDDEALGLLDTAKAHYSASFGPRSAPVANCNSNLSIIYGNRGDHARATQLLDEAASIYETLLGKDDIQMTSVLYNIAVNKRAMHDYPGALAAMHHCVAIYAAKATGSEHHRQSIGLEAAIENDAGDPKRGLELAVESLAFPTPPADPQTTGAALIEQIRALIALHRPEEARPLLVKARAIYTDLKMQTRLGQIDSLAKQLAR